MFLLDTNVVSETRRPKPHGAVLAWFGGVAHDALFLSSVTIAEIQSGIEITRDQNPARAQQLQLWVDTMVTHYKELPMSSVEFKVWAKLMHRESNTVRVDAMIAATALVHGLTVVTRNVGDFQRFGVKVLNPFEKQPFFDSSLMS